jgi:hypothetical protein
MTEFPRAAEDGRRKTPRCPGLRHRGASLMAYLTLASPL